MTTVSSWGLEVQARGFPEIPLFFSGVNDYHAQERLDPNRQTGVFEHKDIGPNLDLLQALPGSMGSSVVIVGDGSTTYRAVAHEIEAELAKRPAIKATFIAGASLEAILARLAETPRSPVPDHPGRAQGRGWPGAESGAKHSRPGRRARYRPEHGGRLPV